MLSLFIPAVSAAAGLPAPPEQDSLDKSVWGEMPAGARSVYIGIHGGTVPVSLLTAGDGSPMIAQVGLTGTDFLYFMRRGGQASPALVGEAEAAPLESTAPAEAADDPIATANTKTDAKAEVKADGQADPALAASSVPVEEELPASPTPAAPLPGNNATLLLAGNAGNKVQVIYATGRAFERMSLVPANWAPFGLTEKPLSMEGEIKILTQPKKLPRNRRASRR